MLAPDRVLFHVIHENTSEGPNIMSRPAINQTNMATLHHA